MERTTIDLNDLKIKPHYLFDRQWALLTSGDFSTGAFNTMTIGWGALGTMWNKPFVFVAVRPTRYTYEFMEEYDTFSVCFFPKERRKALSLIGTRSGRDEPKITTSGLTPQAAEIIPAPIFAEAELVLECQKIYFNDLVPDQFLDQTIEHHYPRKDYHRIYYGEIVRAEAITKYVV